MGPAGGVAGSTDPARSMGPVWSTAGSMSLTGSALGPPGNVEGSTAGMGPTGSEPDPPGNVAGSAPAPTGHLVGSEPGPMGHRTRSTADIGPTGSAPGPPGHLTGSEPGPPGYLAGSEPGPPGHLARSALGPSGHLAGSEPGLPRHRTGSAPGPPGHLTGSAPAPLGHLAGNIASMGPVGGAPGPPGHLAWSAPVPPEYLAGSATGPPEHLAGSAPRPPGHLTWSRAGMGTAGNVAVEPGTMLHTAGWADAGARGEVAAESRIRSLRDSLSRDNWKENEGAKREFARLLLQLKRPHVGATLVREALLPPALLFSDDFELENQLLGVRCLHHIILSTPAAVLRCHNQAHVIHDALLRHLYSKEHKLIQAVHKCLLIILPVLEGPHMATVSPGNMNPMAYTSKVLLITLSHMEMEDMLLLRRIYAQVLPAYIDRLGILIVQHMKPLLGIVVGFLEVSDGYEEEARASILVALKSLIRCAWPRMAVRCGFLVKLLLRFAYDISAGQTMVHGRVQHELLAHVVDCLVLLHHCCGGQVQVLLRDIQKNFDNPGVMHCVTAVFSK